MIYIKPQQQQTKELEFLYSFKESNFFENYINDKKKNYLFIEEPYTGFGYPDLVLLIWNTNISKLWNDDRNKISANHFKIVQHLYNYRRPKSSKEIAKDLGFANKQVELFLSNLYDSGIVRINKNEWILEDVKSIFFLEEIITFEAKLKNWKNAFFQAGNSDYFSSEVFTLFPDNIINDNLMNTFSQSSVGVISFNKSYKVVKPACKKELPITLNGWFFNELVGRKIWQEN